MLSRIVCGARPTQSLLVNAYRQIPRGGQSVREYARDGGRQAFTRQTARVEKPTLKERLMAPAGPNAFSMGRGAVAGGAVLGLGALCYYGVGLGQGTSALQNSMLWPEYVKQRIQSVYMYFGGSIVLSAASAMAVFRTPALLNMVSRSGWISILVTIGAMIASGSVARSIPYQEGLGPKQLAWAVHCGILGAVIAPLCFVGGPILMRAALYTAGIVGGLSTVAACAPSDKFLYMGGPLAIGLGFVFASSMASMFLSPATALGAGIYSISLYGGLLLFSGFLLYDTQRIVRSAEMHPVYAERAFDPVAHAISIYMDTINIFIRIVTILTGGGNRRK